MKAKYRAENEPGTALALRYSQPTANGKQKPSTQESNQDFKLLNSLRITEEDY